MTRARLRRRASGFTLIEMVVTLAIVGLVAMVALPLYELTMTRIKEAELRQALRTIRAGLDAYKAAVDAGLLARAAGESGYPASLEVLVQPLDTTVARNAGASAGETKHRMVILRQLPRDPFHPDLQAPAATTWNTRAYASRPDDWAAGDDVFDVSSKSARVGLDGTAYNTW